MITDTAHGAVTYDQVGQGAHLILLHSLLSDRDVFAAVVPRLARNWTVTSVDLAGFGGTVPTGPGIDAQADVIGALITELGTDPTTTCLLGNGLGAFVALGTAIRHGALFHKLVLVGCGLAFPDDAKSAFHTMIDNVEHGGMEAVLEVAVRRIFTDEFIASHPEIADERRSVLRRTNPAAFIDACRSLLQLDYRDSAATVVNPTLVVVGSEDAATPPSLGKEVAARITGARFVELPGVAHAPQLQAPDRFLEVIEAFLAG
jgi:3-oxoadipate enol-lactonase